MAFAAAVTRVGRAEDIDLVRKRGRQLASRVADVLGRPVEFVDPVSRAVEVIAAGSTGPIARLAVQTTPTPWPTGLTVAGFFAVFVGIGDTVLSRAFAEAFGFLWLPANLLVGLGLAPTLWLLRSTPVWRWVALGATVGLGIAWVVLLFGQLA
jgi:hypothetical protein